MWYNSSCGAVLYSPSCARRGLADPGHEHCHRAERPSRVGCRETSLFLGRTHHPPKQSYAELFALGLSRSRIPFRVSNRHLRRRRRSRTHHGAFRHPWQDAEAHHRRRADDPTGCSSDAHSHYRRTMHGDRILSRLRASASRPRQDPARCGRPPVPVPRPA